MSNIERFSGISELLDDLQMRLKDEFAKKLSNINQPNSANCAKPIPVEPDGGIGDGAGPPPMTSGPGPIPVEPDGGIGDGAGPPPMTGGPGPIPVEPDGGIGDGAGPPPMTGGPGPIPVEPDGGIGDGAGPLSLPDPINGTDGSDRLRGTKGDDTIITGDGFDIVKARRGNDTIIVDGSGSKFINGGAGTDRVELQGAFEDYKVKQLGGNYVLTSSDGSKIFLKSVEEALFQGTGELFREGQPPERPGQDDIDPQDGVDPSMELDPDREGSSIQGTNGDDQLVGTDAAETFTTGQGRDSVQAGGGDDRITVDGIGDKSIDGGAGSDTVALKGVRTDYTVNGQGTDLTFTSPLGQNISVSNVEQVLFEASGQLVGIASASEGTNDQVGGGSFDLLPNDLGAERLDIMGDTARLTGPGTDFTFTGVDTSLLALDGPITATGGSGTINGEETTAISNPNQPMPDPDSPFGNDPTSQQIRESVLLIQSGFNLGGEQGVSAFFANGDVLDTAVARPG